ncbi:MAG: DUF362 domain-containing protein [Treponema sp.]|nr:DUF362 domain-containing protein [Treponema sp.]
MAKPEVYFTDFTTPIYGTPIPKKFEKLIRRAGIEDIDMNGKFVAIKIHFGELGNLSYLRPNFARTVVEVVKSLGGKPYLTDCNTLYPGFRKNALEHLECAWANGFTPLTVGCPILIGDGLKGTDDIEVPVEGGVQCKTAKIGRAVMDADIFISLNHFKGHEEMGFGGALKNIGMGCGSRAGKKDMHSTGKPTIDQLMCRGCKLCAKQCANDGFTFDPVKKKMSINENNCLGCGRCIGACNFDAISFKESNSTKDLNIRVAEYSKAVLAGRPNFHISLICDVSPNCDCHQENGAPILPDIGMLASFDPVALDQACVDLCRKEQPLPKGDLAKNIAKPDFKEMGDHWKNNHPNVEWETLLIHSQELGLGSRDYELVEL